MGRWDGTFVNETRAPKQNDRVTVTGHTGRFVVISIDSIHKTVEVRTTATMPVIVAKDVPWTAITVQN